MALCKAPMWLRGPCSLKCCLLDREVDLDKARASLCLVGRNGESKGCHCLPTSHYLDLIANCHYRTHRSHKEIFQGMKKKTCSQ